MSKILNVVIISLLFSGCASTWIDRASGKYKNVFVSGADKASIRNDLGENPLKTYVKNSTDTKTEYSYKDYCSYEVYDVTGKIHKPGDGAAQATINAISLGIGELILLPITVGSVVLQSVKSHTLVVFYNCENKYISHKLYDANGNSEDTLGY